MTRKMLVTSALPYANGPIHIGHLVEYLQTDIWVRFQKACGNTCFYFCADDTHGTPIMIRAKSEGITPETLIERVHKDHYKDFLALAIVLDNIKHSEENRILRSGPQHALEAGLIVEKKIEQAYYEQEKMAARLIHQGDVSPAKRRERRSCDICAA